MQTALSQCVLRPKVKKPSRYNGKESCRVYWRLLCCKHILYVLQLNTLKSLGLTETGQAEKGLLYQKSVMSVSYLIIKYVYIRKQMYLNCIGSITCTYKCIL